MDNTCIGVEYLFLRLMKILLLISASTSPIASNKIYLFSRRSLNFFSAIC